MRTMVRLVFTDHENPKEKYCFDCPDLFAVCHVGTAFSS
jgi:hypothetical protein